MQVKQEADEVITTKMEGPGRVTMKNSKKVAAGKRLAEYNHREREELVQVTKAQKSKSKPKLSSSRYYSIGAGYYAHQSKKGEVTKVTSVD